MALNPYSHGKGHAQEVAESGIYRPACPLSDKGGYTPGWHLHASYNVAKKVLAFVYQVAIPRSHLRASYGDGFQGAPLRCKNRQEEGSFTRGSGVCDEQAFSQENQDR